MSSDPCERFLSEVATITLERGWAVGSVVTLQFLPVVDAWGYPKYPDRTLILEPESELMGPLRQFIATNRALLIEPNCWLGTWVHPDTQRVFLDVTTSTEGLLAALEAVGVINRRSQRAVLAIYNSAQNKTVFLAETASSP